MRRESAVKVDRRANFAENASVIHEFVPKKFMDDAERDVKRPLAVSARFNYIFHRFCVSISV